LKFSENTSLIKEAFSMFVEATTEPDFNVGIKEVAFLNRLKKPLLVERLSSGIPSLTSLMI